MSGRSAYRTRAGSSSDILPLLASLTLSRCAPTPVVSAQPPPPQSLPARVAQPPPTLPPVERYARPRPRESQTQTGLRISVLPRPRAPLVDVRLVMMGGTASDGARPGVARLATQLLKESGSKSLPGRELSDSLQALGARLEVRTTLDASILQLTVAPEDFDTALRILADLVRDPQLDETDFEVLQHRQQQLAMHAARGDSHWVSRRALFAELFSLETKPHPYARPTALAEEIRELTWRDCRRWLRRHVSPQHSVVQVTGQVSAVAAHKAVQRAFGDWRGQAVSPPIFFKPRMPSPRRTLVVDRPGSAQSELRVALLGPTRRSPGFTALAVAARVLGAPQSGRLTQRLERSQGLAHRVSADVLDVAYGPSPFVLSASTRTDETSRVLRIMLEELHSLTSQPVSADELSRATRYLRLSAPLSLHTTRSAAALVETLNVLSLPSDYLGSYDAGLEGMTPLDLQMLAGQHLTADRTLIVIAGDAERIAEPLRGFGQVQILDPEDGFRLKRVLTRRAAPEGR